MVLANETPASRQLPTGTITFLFTDVEGSTRLWEHYPDAMRQALVRHDAILTNLIEQHSGIVVRERGEGDSFFAVFTRPSDAILAASAIQRSLQRESWPIPQPLRVRIAIHTGEADLRDGGYYGSEVNRCARLRALTRGGQTLISQASAELIRRAPLRGISLSPVRPQRLKDLKYPEQPYEVLPEVDKRLPRFRRAIRGLAYKATHSLVGGAVFVGTLAVFIVLVVLLLGQVGALSILSSSSPGPPIEVSTPVVPRPPATPAARYWRFADETATAVGPSGIELRLSAENPTLAVGEEIRLKVEISNPSNETQELVFDSDPIFSVSVTEVRGGKDGNTVYAFPKDNSFGFVDQIIKIAPHSKEQRAVKISWRLPAIDLGFRPGQVAYRIDVDVWLETKVALSLALSPDDK